MKYHYKIVSSFDPTDIPVDSSKYHENYEENGEWKQRELFKGFDTEDTADVWGELKMKELQYNPDQYYVRVYEVPEKEIDDNHWWA